jgi:hypothetical protein
MNKTPLAKNTQLIITSIKLVKGSGETTLIPEKA